MKIANGIEMLEIEASVMNETNYIYPVLQQSGSENILVDTGYPGQTCYPKILQSLLSLGLTAKDITKIILTHQDLDHIGGLPAFLNANPAIEVLCHKEEKPYVEGEKKLVKISSDARHSMENLPEHVRSTLLKVFENPPTAPVHTVLEDGQNLPILGGMTVIHTPGHTPGHICLYIRDAKLLISGDALVAQKGKLFGPAPEHAQDLKLAMQSLQKLKNLDIEKIICYHGGLVQNAAEQLKKLMV